MSVQVSVADVTEADLWEQFDPGEVEDRPLH